MQGGSEGREGRSLPPDQRNENVVRHGAGDAVIVEFDLLGTMEASCTGSPPPAGASPSHVRPLSVLAGRTGIVCECVYFDQATTLQQLLS